jgi:hypothetical protein
VTSKDLNTIYSTTLLKGLCQIKLRQRSKPKAHRSVPFALLKTGNLRFSQFTYGSYSNKTAAKDLAGLNPISFMALKVAETLDSATPHIRLYVINYDRGLKRMYIDPYLLVN